MRKFWEVWMVSTITVGKMKAFGFGVIFLADIFRAIAEGGSGFQVSDIFRRLEGRVDAAHQCKPFRPFE
jgi:hypothetical protein